jgi:hypothetical protein
VPVRAAGSVTADSGALVRVEHDGPWLVLVIERPKRTKRVYLSMSDAALVVAVLSRELPPVEVRHVPGRPS